ncbi:aldehyde dehydrogenase family protein [Streptomyces sp. SID8361]|uniref:aldehyde dehydrogenase family protein n=1 Tax=Streptomyces sp. MnatMP-M27 TaxID=1839768 RepID=UPI00081E9003|nr:aldehyde dehydrogenase family protein [Streptomyces sp. MnatMP-M27]MYU09558.1 aldehyde dehydrogenase family protein [Streptomyces sp. SID8361]SCF63044.1 Acyl-CoA reductase [Streptomyces sp. MnatMP-M27]
MTEAGTSGARIEYVRPETADPKIAETLRQLPPLRVYGLMAASPGTFLHWNRLGQAMVYDLSIPAVLRELVILQVGTLVQRYEWDQHVPLARHFGVSEEQIAGIAGGDRFSAFSPAESAALSFVVDLVRDGEVGDEDYTRLASAFSERQIVEIAMVATQYLALGRVMTAVRIEADEPSGPAGLAVSTAATRSSAPDGDPDLETPEWTGKNGEKKMSDTLETAVSSRTPVIGEERMLIDGQLVAAASGKTYPNINPATEEVLGVTADAGTEDVDRAIAAARRAFDETDWATDHAFRRRCIEQLGDAILAAADDLRRIDTAEIGFPVSSLRGTFDPHLPRIREMAELAETYEYEQPLPDGVGILQREGIGVVAAIMTWNCGFMLWTTKVIPALAAGNTVVVRAAPEAPWGSTLIGRLIAEHTDIPAGVVNVVTSSNRSASVQLSQDPRVDMVTFTGSTQVGRQIMAQAAGTIKKVLLELGGKSANIVLPDGDLKAAITASAALSCMVAGEACGLPSRILLPRERYEEGVQFAAELFNAVKPGDPLDPNCGQGPQISAAQRDRILAMIEQAKNDGARVVAGGGKPDLERGFYVQPTIIADVDPDSAIAQDEVFGPVLAVIPYDDEEDAIRIANNSIYGLYGAVYSADTDHATAVARRIRAGSMMVNGFAAFDKSPFGGYKQSGLGREVGLWGFEEFLEMKGITLPTAEAASRTFN